MEPEEILKELKFERALAEKRDKAFLASLESIFDKFSKVNSDEKFLSYIVELKEILKKNEPHELSELKVIVENDNKQFFETANKLIDVIEQVILSSKKEKKWVFDVKRGASNLIQQVVATSK